MFLTIVTRCCRRPIALNRNIQSVQRQTSQNWEQLFLVDMTGRHKEDSVLWANKQFERYADLVRGEYVYALDDDGYLIDEGFIDALERRAIDEPDVILVKMRTFNLDQRWTVQPQPIIWDMNWEEGKRPEQWAGNGFCVVVKREVWKAHIKNYQTAPGGDWHFISSLIYNPDLAFARLNMVASSSPGRGCGVIFEKCGTDWFQGIASRYETERITGGVFSDGVWRLEP